MLQYLLARAKEPSSYAGLAMLLTAAGIHFSAAEFSAVVNVLVAIAGAVAVFVPESKAAKSVMVLMVIGATAMSLAACSAVTAAHDLKTASTIAGDIGTALAAACREEPAVEAAAQGIVGNASADATSLEGYANAVCANPAGPTVDASTAVWIGQIQGAIKSLAAAKPGP